MRDEAQVSATIVTSTKERLDRFTLQLGLKKNFVVEQAVLYYMEARRELPDEAFIPTRIVLSEQGFDALVGALEAPAPPTARLVSAMIASSLPTRVSAPRPPGQHLGETPHLWPGTGVGTGGPRSGQGV